MPKKTTGGSNLPSPPAEIGLINISCRGFTIKNRHKIAFEQQTTFHLIFIQYKELSLSYNLRFLESLQPNETDLKYFKL